MQLTTGTKICTEYGLSVLELAQACHEGKLSAFSSFDRKKIIPTSQCEIRRKNPIQFCVKDFPFIPKRILLHEDISTYFNVYINNEEYVFLNNQKNLYNNDNYFCIDTNDTKLKLHLAKYNFETQEFRNDIFDGEISCVQPKIILELKDLYESKKINVSIIAMKIDEISQNNQITYTINEYITVNIDNKIISINQQESSKLLLLSNNFSVRHNLQKNGVKNVNHISSDKLEFLWNNDFIYYTKDGEELDNIRFFIFDYATYKKLHNYYNYDNDILSESFEKSLHSFLYDKSEVDLMMQNEEDSRLLEKSPKCYIINIYKRLGEKTKNKKEQRNINAYIDKINGVSHEAIGKSIDIYDNSTISRMVSSSIEKIAKKYKIPYIHWHDFSHPQEEKRKKDVEITTNIKNQLKNLQENV